VIPTEFLLFAFLMVIALMISRLRHLFAAAMLSGMFSLVSAGLFTLMDAVDVAFTEAAVGAGVSTILLLGTLSLTSHEERQRPIRILPFVIVFLTGAALFVGTLDMPAYGDPQAPIHLYLESDYVRGTQAEFGIPNIVTAVLASYRGYDTLGETAVIFTAAVGILALLIRGSGPEKGADS